MKKVLIGLIVTVTLAFISIPAGIIMIEHTQSMLCRMNITDDDRCIVWAMRALIINPSAFFKDGEGGVEKKSGNEG